MTKFLQKILKFLAEKIVSKYQPLVIGITGSVGKTSTKEAVAIVLSEKYILRKTSKSYNNEIGLPLTVIGADSPGSNILGWIKITFFALWQLVFLNKKYPEVLVLEMAADHPGDIAYLVKITSCDVGVLTAIAPTHLEYFKSLENIKKEKLTILTHLSRKGIGIYNADDPNLEDLPKIKAKLFSYSLNNSNADLQAVDIKEKFSEIYGFKYIDGFLGKLKYQDAVVPFYLPGIISREHIYSALAAVAVGLSLDMNLVEITRALENYKAPPGRLNLLTGIKRSFIIDDSYNSSPRAAKVALDVLVNFPSSESGRKIAVLGDMNELGDLAEEAHKELGKQVYSHKIDMLITFGKFAKFINSAAEELGMPKDKSFHFDSHEEIIKFLKDNLSPGDVVLVKGSQNKIRLENVVKGIMAHPESARELLVRQGPEWVKS